MRRLILLGVLLAVGPCAENLALAHGGVYRRPPPPYLGPGDTLAVPAPSGALPSGPRGPIAPRPGAATGAPTASSGASTGGAPPGESDLTSWEVWWGFNKDAYLDVKSAVQHVHRTTPEDFFTDPENGWQTKDVLAPSEDSVRKKIVPALVRVLEKERSNDIVTGALVALAKIGDAESEHGASEFEAIIGRFLADPNQEIAETAACALGILGHASSIQTLESLLQDAPEGRTRVGSSEVSTRIRAFAAFALGLVGNRASDNATRQRIARTLVGALRARDSSSREVQVAAIIALGLVPVDVDREPGDEGDSEPWISRQAELAFIDSCSRSKTLEPVVRAHAPAALARLLAGAPDQLRIESTKPLIEALAKHSKERDEVRQGCALALGQIGDCDDDPQDREIRSTLKRMVEDGDQQSRHFALVALGQIGGRPGVGARAGAALQETREFLLAILTKGRSRLRPWAALAIGVLERAQLDAGRLQSGVAKAAMRAALLECENPSDVGAYAIATGIAKDDEAADILRAKLDGLSDRNARGSISIALGLIGARNAIEPIQRIVRQSKYDPELLKQAAIALGLLGDKDLVPELIAMLREAKSLASQGALASALGFIGDSRSIDPLVRMLEKPGLTARARGFAAVALGIVADREPLPWNSKISANVNYRASTSTLTSDDAAGILDML